MAFVQRAIDVEITLGQGDFGEGKGNTVTLSNYAVRATVTKGGAPSWDSAQVRIFGVSRSLMNQLTRLGKPLAYPRNNVMTVMAGDNVNGKSQVFKGIILTAYGDFTALPDSSLVLVAIGNIFQAVKPVAPLSYPNPTPASTIAAQIAAQMALGFINDGVSVVIPKSYFPGSSVQQLQKLAETGNFNYITNGGSAGQSLEIWPKGQSRGAMGPLISNKNGTLVGYPKYSDAGADIAAIYQPGMGLGSAFTLETSLDSAAGTWFVLQIDYDLGCNDPKGSNPWFMNVSAQRASFAS